MVTLADLKASNGADLHHRPLCQAPLLINGGFDQARAETWLAENWCDAVAFGRLFIANPDFYQGGEKGYVDYPAWEVAT